MVMIEGYVACTNPIAAFGYVSHTNQTALGYAYIILAPIRALEYRPSCQSCHEIRVLQYVAMESNQHTSLLTHTKKTLKNNEIIYVLRKDFVAATCQG